MIVPKSFGQYGHYRGDALNDIAARTPTFAGREACEACHQDIVDLKKTGKHVNRRLRSLSWTSRQTCRGSRLASARKARHRGPLREVPRSQFGQAQKFPQVISKEHAGDVACGTCHQPHKPKIGDDRHSRDCRRSAKK